MADKKAVPLRISEKLYSDLASWAEDDFRSLNGQIEYLLTECVRQRRKNGGHVGKENDKPLEVDLRDTKKTDRG
ncbi:MAG: PTS ascorbate transporter subunit IIC [Ruminococcus sp.]|nr:PTS ascorbate transporter subunit IIC [Ruminococcus sp.]